MAEPALILASKSTARAALLAAAGYRFRIVSSGVMEPPLPRGGDFRRHLAGLAAAKAMAVARRYPRAFVIGADTALLFEGRMIGKGRDPATARRILRGLCGRSHRISTAVCIIAPAPRRGVARRVYTGVESAVVRLRGWNARRIAAYVRAIRPFACAGAYALQDGGSAIISSVRGDVATVVGLPVDLVIALLAKAGYAPVG